MRSARSVGPVAVWAVAVLVGAGALAPWLYRAGSGAAWAVTVVGLAAVWGAVVLGGRRRGLVTVLALLAVATGIGAVRFVALDRGPLAELARTGGARPVAAVVVEEPRVATDGGRSPRWWTVVRVERVADVRTRERALLRGVGEDTPPVGSRWTGTVTAAPIDDPGFGAYLRRRYTAVAIDPRTWQPADPPGVLLRTTEDVRARVRTAAEAALPEAHAGLATGLVTGDTSLLPEDVDRAMRDTGLTHLVAVSGSNVAIVAAGLLALASGLTLGPSGRRVLVGTGLVWFAVLTRWEPSVLRATAMALIVLSAGSRGVIGDPRSSLALAITALVLIDPGLAGSLGMLLSASATAGVLVLAPIVRDRLERLPGRLADLLAVTVGAQLAVAPVLLLSVGEVPLSSVPANLVAVPAAAAASAVAITGAVLAAVHPLVGAPLFAIARPALSVILWAAEGFRGWSAVVSLQRPRTLLIAVLVALVLLARSRRLATLSLAAVGVLVAPSLLPIPAVRGLVVTAIDVGQGDAVLVEAPGATLLVDGGWDDRAARWLRRAGRHRLDAVVVSHGHADHVGGLPTVVRRSEVGALWVPDVPVDLAAHEQLLGIARGRGVPVVHPVVGQQVSVGSLLIRVLAPPPGRPYRAQDSELNDTSIVLRVDHAGSSALLTGDVEEAAQRDLLASGAPLRAGLLKVPHHGAGTTEPAFLQAVGAHTALVSVGAGNRYGHPAPRTIEQLERSGAHVRRTDLHGTIRVAVAATAPELADGRDSRDDDAPLASTSRPTLRIASPHVRSQPRLPPRRRRRPPPPPRARAPPGRAAVRRPGPGRRARQRGGGDRSARDAHRVAVRR